MPTTRKAPPNKPAVESKTKPVNIFISYASEDKEIAQRIENILKSTFAYAHPLPDIKRDVEIKEGANWVQEINNYLDAADILLVIFTERMKYSHSYTGYEIGYFKKSTQVRPKGTEHLQRIYLPLCIGAEIPETMHYIQGIKIDRSEVFNIAKLDAGPLKAADITDKNPAYRLLKRISEAVMQGIGLAPAPEPSALRDWAADLHNSIYEYLQSRVSSETFPERKIVIRCDKRPAVEAGRADLSNSTLELLGKSFDLFGIEKTIGGNREFRWPELEERLKNEGAAVCLELIQKIA